MSAETKKIHLAFSPCPNDTFMFDAMIHGKIDTEGLEFNVELHDIETLNKKALQSVFDVSKISFFAFTSVAEQYQLLTSGSALGTNCGPLLISKKEIKLSDFVYKSTEHEFELCLQAKNYSKCWHGKNGVLN